jgi:hypothetical protein
MRNGTRELAAHYSRKTTTEFCFRFMPQIGFFRVKSHLEELLHKKYRECATPTLQLLNQMVQQLQQETETLDRELRSADMEKQKSKALEFVDLTLGIMDKLLQGSVIGDPDTWGQTLEEERTSSGMVMFAFTKQARLIDWILSIQELLLGLIATFRTIFKYQMRSTKFMADRNMKDSCRSLSWWRSGWSYLRRP